MTNRAGNSSFGRIIALLDATSRRRALTEQESRYLEWALMGQAGEAGHGYMARSKVFAS